MNQLKNKRSRILFLVFLFCMAINIILIFYLGGSMRDLLGQRKICAYTLKGYDPFALAISGEIPIKELGDVPSDYSTVPWACILGNIFYPSFITFTAAKVYVTILQLVVCILATWLVYNKCKDYVKNQSVLLIALSLLGHFCFVYSWSLGNNGAVISCLIISAICLADDHPYLAGALIGISMVKPQNVAIVCIVFLLNKKWKPLFVGAAMDILGWIATSVMTTTPFMTLLSECFVPATSAERHYYGVLSPLSFFGVAENIVLLMNAVVGVVYTYILWRYFKQKGVQNTIETYVPAFIASTIWTYKNGSDYMMVVLATILFIYICLDESTTLRDFWLSIGCILCLQMSRLGVNVMQKIFNSYFLRTLLKSAEGMLLMGIGVIFCVLWVKYKGSRSYGVKK